MIFSPKDLAFPVLNQDPYQLKIINFRTNTG